MRVVKSAMECIIGRFCPVKELWGGFSQELMITGRSAGQSQGYLREGGGWWMTVFLAGGTADSRALLWECVNTGWGELVEDE